jgi:hypothetical protein
MSINVNPEVPMPMPMQLLERLCGAHFPITLDAQDDIEKCAVLRAAKLIEADIPPFIHARGTTRYSGQATVMCVTAKGRAASSEGAGVPVPAPAEINKFTPSDAKKSTSMDLQLLLRLDRMAPPRILTLTADIAAAKRLVDDGMIEASMQMRANKRQFAPNAMHVRAITKKGRLAAAREKAPHPEKPTFV